MHYPVRLAEPSSPKTRDFDFVDVDFAHLHHRGKGALGLGTACGYRADEGAGRDLPRQPPTILAPAARAFLATATDDRIPIAVSFLLRVCRDLKEKNLAVHEFRPAIES